MVGSDSPPRNKNKVLHDDLCQGARPAVWQHR